MKSLIVNRIGWKGRIILVLFVLIESCYFWYLSANYPAYFDVNTYYFVGFLLFLGVVAAYPLLDKWVDIRIWKDNSWHIAFQTLSGLIIFLFLLYFPTHIGTATLGYIPHSGFVSGFNGLVENFVWFGWVFPTIMLWSLGLFLAIPGCMLLKKTFKEWLKDMEGNLHELEVKTPIFFYTVAVILMIMNAWIFGFCMIRAFHEHTYNNYCEKEELTDYQCNRIKDRVGAFGFMGSIITYVSGSIVPISIAHFLNNYISG